MKLKIFYCFILLILLIITLSVSTSTYNLNNSDKVQGKVFEKLERNNFEKVIIKLYNFSEKKDNFIKKQGINGNIKDLKEELLKEFSDGEFNKSKVRHVFRDSIAVEINKEDLEKLKNNPYVKSVFIDREVHAFLQDSVNIINASAVWPIQINGINLTGKGETICVIDTGIDFTHPDLIGKNLTCNIDCINEYCVENCSVTDDNGHGTHVAGIIAANGKIKGVAPDANLIGVKILDSNGDGYSSDIRDGIDWCSNDTNIQRYNISVISMSLGTLENYTDYCDYQEDYVNITKSINDAVGKNISVIVATGNSHNYTAIAFPSCIKNSTAIGSTDKSDAIASYSNRNNITDLFAPGTNINSTVPQDAFEIYDESGYKTVSGTSMACPHVAGAFAIINQFFKLQNNRTATPQEIQDILNSTGEKINDSSSGLNFSRIDIYSAIISIDNSNPDVQLNSPENDLIQLNQTVNFTCSANKIELNNLTLYVWNNSQEVNKTTNNTSASTIELRTTLNLPYSNYKWNCFACSNNGNCSFAESNYTLDIQRIKVSLNSPLNNSFNNENSTNFSCLSESISNFSLVNTTFYLWNSSNDLINISTQNISGINNLTSFYYNLSYNENYTWNCISFNNNSDSIFAQKNYTIFYDKTAPNLTLIEPFPQDENAILSSKIFYFNVTDLYKVSCSLWINNNLNQTKNITNFTKTQNFTATLLIGDYNWKISCTDLANNQINSSEKNFTISAPHQQISSSSRSSNSKNTIDYHVYVPTENETKIGYTKKLNKSDKIKFKLIDDPSNEHYLIIENIIDDSVNITIQSNTVNLILLIGQNEKLNMTSQYYYDLYVKLEKIIGSQAEITIKTINEKIENPDIEVTGEAIENTDNEKQEQKTNEVNLGSLNPYIQTLKIIMYSLVSIFIITVLFTLLHKVHKKTRKKIDMEEKANENLKTQ
jgi:subtilisin family serine protease